MTEIGNHGEPGPTGVRGTPLGRFQAQRRRGIVLGHSHVPYRPGLLKRLWLRLRGKYPPRYHVAGSLYYVRETGYSTTMPTTQKMRRLTHKPLDET